MVALKNLKVVLKVMHISNLLKILEKLTHIIVLLFCVHSFDKAFHYKETTALNSIIGRQLIITSHISFRRKSKPPIFSCSVNKNPTFEVTVSTVLERNIVLRYFRQFIPERLFSSPPRVLCLNCAMAAAGFLRLS